MLVAQQQNGELLVLTKTIAPELLKELRQQQSFYCPQCKEPLILKVGAIKIPHFAHHKQSACEQSFSEGETLMHLLGKQQLFHLFESLQLPVQLEKTLTPLQQRPDLYIELPHKRYAIEFQYSTLDPQIFHERSAGYLSHAIQPIWLVQTPNAIEICGVQRLNISHFLQLFIQQYNQRIYICTYNPKKEMFYYVQPILHLHKNSYIAKVDNLPIKQQRFPFLVPKAITFESFQAAYTIYKENQLSHLRAIFKYNRQGVQHLFLRYLYELRLGLEELPIYLYAPIKDSEAMQAVHSGWQCALFYFAQQLGKYVWELKMSEVQLFFTCMKLPLNVRTVEVLRRYVRLCKKLQLTSHRLIIDEQRLVTELFEQYTSG